MDTTIVTSGNGAADADLIKDTDLMGFKADVLDASQHQPVIVDFWAPWCGPCKQLTPALESAVRAAKGAVRLVKINVDENQEIAAQMRIQSIPAVFAFKDGQPVDGFMGALPESQITAFIEKLAGTSLGDDELEALIEAAQAAIAAEDHAGAAQLFVQALQRDPEHVGAIAGLAKCQIAGGDLEGAAATLALTPPQAQDDAEIISARTALELAANPADDGEIVRLEAAVAADGTDHQARIDLALALNAAGNREAALDQLIESIAVDREWNEGAARKQLLQFFEAWGFSDALSVTGRRRLSTILFS